MSDALVFMMGKHEARFPTDRHYAKNHMWARRDGEQTWTFGFSAYAVRLLQDVYFLEWSVDPGSTVRERTEIGDIESSKAESALYAPMPGDLTEFNADLLSDPSAINVDTYGKGWLFRMQGSGEPLLDPEQYMEHLKVSWVVAERTIKGQANQDH